MRVVDLDAVIDCIEVEWGYDGIREDLYSLPVVDAVPVVRCKDCKWCEYWDSCKEYKCWHIGDGKIIPVEPNGYCSYGEYRTNTGGMTHE